MITELLTALCLVMVIEGILPFLSPDAYKQALRTALDADNRKMRMVGLCSMIGGVTLLTFVR